MSSWFQFENVDTVDNPLIGEAVTSADWRFDLCDRDGNFIVSLDPFVTEREFVFNLNRPCSVSGKVASDQAVINTTHGDGYPYLSAGDRTIKCYRWEYGEWRIRFAGIVWHVTDEGDEAIAYTKFTAFDPFQFLFKRLARDWDDGSFVTTVHVANNAAAAIYRHVSRTIAEAGPCYINVEAGYFEPGLTYLTFQYEQEYLARVLMEICDTGVVDVILEPVDYTNGELVILSAQARRGFDREDSVLFEWDTGDKVALNWSRELDFETTANSITNFTGNKKKNSPQEDEDSQDRFGVCESSQTLTDIYHQDLLDALTSQELVERKVTREIVGVIPQPETGSRIFDHFFLGDTVTVSCSDQAREAITGVQRIYGITLQVDDEGVERITELRVSPNQE